jgi:hypothetical protein
MGAPTKKTEAAAPAASVTTTPEVAPQNPETVPVEIYNQAIEIAEGQGKRIEVLEAEVEELKSDLNTANHTIAELTQELDQAEGTILNLAHQVAPVKENVAAADTEPSEPKTSFDYNGRTYGFAANTPAALFHDDRLYTQEELLNDPEAMTALIVGENGFIKQLH